MREKNYSVMAACLLHDVGKVLYRAGIGNGNHSQRGAEFLKNVVPKQMLNGIRYHHQTELVRAKLNVDDLAYITCIADNISSAADRRNLIEGEQEQGFRKYAALESIFNHIGTTTSTGKFVVDQDTDEVQFPSANVENDTYAYKKTWQGFADGLKGIDWTPDYSNSLIELVQRYFSYVPSSTAVQQRCDISLYHHSKTTAAIGCCIRQYLESAGRNDYKSELLDHEESFMNEKAFLLYTLDVSGIQSFIYTISEKGALKGLRARSFYLSILLEDVVDSILESLGLFRTNLIYCGGGRAHLLLPNTDEVHATIQKNLKEVNAFLRRRFGTSLYLASGKCPCSGNDLTSNGGKDDSFVKLFRETSLQISKRKMQRYDAAELLELNRRIESDDERECVVCGSTGKLIHVGGDRILCETCDQLEKFAETFKETEDLLIVERTDSTAALPLTGNRWLRPATESEARRKLRTEPDSIVRLYGVNKSYTGLKLASRISVGNYSASHANGRRLTFEELAEYSQGVKRLGVFRADVDNLGAMFARGFYDASEANPWRFATLSRYTALSIRLTDFFQREINRIVRGSDEQPRNVSIVYAGGDDVFLIGAWNEVLDAGFAIRSELRRYTNDAVTLSAGFAFFKENTPVAVMAEATADLEDDAKTISDGEKNAISLFEPVNNVYHWDVLINDILREKFETIRSVMISDDDNGNAFLYSVVELLRSIQPNTMAIARLAYTLSRHAPAKYASAAAKQSYEHFQQRVYQWAMQPEENRKLQTAILYYVYLNRKEQ